jgi:amidohydrolase
MMAAADHFHLVIHGKGGHAARPHAAIDPIALAGAVIQAVHQIVSRKLDPIESGVITIGAIHGGTANNIIPDSVTMNGTIRAFTPQSRDLLRRELAQTVTLVESLGGRYEYTLHPGYPPTINAEAATAVFQQAASDLLGADRVVEGDMIMGAEDFSYMAQTAPGCFIRLGVHDPAWGDTYYNVHRSDFQMHEDALPVGAATLAASAIQWMESQAGR